MRHLFFILPLITILSCQSRRIDEIKPTDSMMTPMPALSKPLSFQDVFRIGVPREQIRHIFDEASVKIESSPFGKLNSEVEEYTVSDVKWWGLDGTVRIKFSEETGKSKHVEWVSNDFITPSDRNIL